VSPRKALRIRTIHAHGCVVCSQRYCDACATPFINGTCPEHQVLTRPRPLWDRNRDPRDCCRTNSREADHDTRQLYALGGTGPWWICRVCSRTHPYDPGTGR
jgi:hypothetical protein